MAFYPKFSKNVDSGHVEKIEKLRPKWDASAKRLRVQEPKIDTKKLRDAQLEDSVRAIKFSKWLESNNIPKLNIDQYQVELDFATIKRRAKILKRKNNLVKDRDLFLKSGADFDAMTEQLAVKYRTSKTEIVDILSKLP